jgi:hypothetical protein
VFDGIGALQGGLALVLTLGGLGVMAYALIDALRVRPEAFPAAGKQTKNIWLLILGIALAANLALFNVLTIFGIAGVIAAAVYILDVRPAVNQFRGGRSSDDGPYGSW